MLYSMLGGLLNLTSITHVLAYLHQVDSSTLALRTGYFQ